MCTSSSTRTGTESKILTPINLLTLFNSLPFGTLRPTLVLNFSHNDTHSCSLTAKDLGEDIIAFDILYHLFSGSLMKFQCLNFIGSDS